MITYTVLMLILAGVLFLARKKIKWGVFAGGMLVAFLLLGTPIGAPLTEAVQSVAGATTQAGNSILSAFGVNG